MNDCTTALRLCGPRMIDVYVNRHRREDMDKEKYTHMSYDVCMLIEVSLYIHDRRHRCSGFVLYQFLS